MNGMGFRYGYGLKTRPAGGGGGGGSGPPAFSMQPETETVATAMTATGTSFTNQRLLSLDRAIRRSKAAGIWNKITALYCIAETEAQWQVNLRNPGTNNLTKVGAPTFTARQTVACTANDYYDTGIPLSAINATSHHFGGIFPDATSNASGDFGAIDGSSSGISLNVRNQSTGTLAARSMGAVVNTVGTSPTWSGGWGYFINRTAAGNFRAYRHGEFANQVSNTSAANVSSVTLAIGKINGSTSSSGRPIGMITIGAGMTDAEMQQLHAIWRTYYEHVRFGDLNVSEAGYANPDVTYDLVVYGYTSQGLAAAYSAARRGMSVAVVGGWRDWHGTIGGMSGNGLGYADFDSQAALGGLPRDMFEKIKAEFVYGTTTNYRFVPWHWKARLLSMLDGTRTNGYNIPLFTTAGNNGSPGGVTSVAKTGTRITQFSTADGRTFKGRYFMDCSYEGDLIALAGVSTIVGREAAGSNFEGANGYRGTLTGRGSDKHQMALNPNGPGTLLTVDPYNTPGDPGSGLIPMVDPDPGLTVGQADGATQAYNFRMTMAQASSFRVLFPTTPPAGYTSAKWELLFRYLAAKTAAGWTSTTYNGELNNVDSTRFDYLDVNNCGGISTNFIGGSIAYTAAATYAEREPIWKAHEQHIREFFYAIRYETDSRVPTGLKNTTQIIGLAADHYLDPHPNDSFYWPGQLYVREFRRMVGDYIHNANDGAATDGTTPRSTKTIAVQSYAQDSHHMRRFARTDGTPRVWMEGNFFESSAGGSNLTAPLPMEAVLPKASECTNIAAPFCVSSTHAAFGQIRMEFTSMLAAEAMAIASGIAIDNGNQDLHSVDYPTLRAELLALPYTNPVVIPQVN